MGYLPSPQSLKDPKSLYHWPSGTSGLDSIQIRSRFRSFRLILRSCMRSTKCWRIAGGRLDQVSICGTIHQRRNVLVRRPTFLLLQGLGNYGNARPSRKRPFPCVFGPQDPVPPVPPTRDCRLASDSSLLLRSACRPVVEGLRSVEPAWLQPYRYHTPIWCRLVPKPFRMNNRSLGSFRSRAITGSRAITRLLAPSK